LICTRLIADTDNVDDDPAYIVDIDALAGRATGDAQSGGDVRPWVGVHFDCCGLYLRIYRNRSGTAYEGACPRCHRRVRVAIGPGGTAERIFRAV